MLLTLAAILVILWLLGFVGFHVAIVLLHVLVVLPVIVVIVEFGRGRAVCRSCQRRPGRRSTDGARPAGFTARQPAFFALCSSLRRRAPRSAAAPVCPPRAYSAD